VTEVTVACCQLAPRVGDTEANREACSAAIEDAAARGAQVVVLPELANSGYVFADEAEARRCSEPLDGETVGTWAELAREHDLVIVGGVCERAEDALHNTAVIIDAAGLRAAYRKAHLWDREKLFFAAGSDAPPVVDTPHGRIATVVCYDLEFPEWVRRAALDGAELLCAPTNWPRETIVDGERPAEVVRVQADASMNRIFIAACDRAGTERGVDWVSGTAIVGPDGFPLAGPVCEDRAVTVTARLDLALARQKRTSPRNDVFGDRRPELYMPGAPRIPASAGAMIFDSGGRLLILKPSYKKGWTIPGGQVEANGESPWEACRRETFEECGLELEHGRLACVDFLRPKPGNPRGVRFLFDCGTFPDERLVALAPADPEIEELALVELGEAQARLSGPVGRRVMAAVARTDLVYLEEGRPL
jgi:predicted amidohydrolase/8-oxo-dGTP pyrophosphatase MutT (NUDIX family)